MGTNIPNIIELGTQWVGLVDDIWVLVEVDGMAIEGAVLLDKIVRSVKGFREVGKVGHLQAVVGKDLCPGTVNDRDSYK